MTNPNQHPHADILRAIADGKEIEYTATTKGIEYRWMICPPKSIFYYLNRPEDYAFRIKPETKTGWIAIYPPGFSGPSGVTIVSDMYQTKQLLEIAMSDKPIAIIQITYTPGEGL